MIGNKVFNFFMGAVLSASLSSLPLNASFAQASGARNDGQIDDLDLFMRSPEIWKKKYLRDHHKELQDERNRLYSTRPSRDSRIVEFQDSSRELQAACSSPISEPLTRQAHHYGGKSQATIYYDINEHGFPVNIEIHQDTNGTDLIKFNSENDVKTSRFKPPVYEGQKLFCRNVREDFYWVGTGAFSNRAVRQRGAHSVSSDLNLLAP